MGAHGFVFKGPIHQSSLEGRGQVAAPLCLSVPSWEIGVITVLPQGGRRIPGEPLQCTTCAGCAGVRSLSWAALTPPHGSVGPRRLAHRLPDPVGCVSVAPLGPGACSHGLRVSLFWKAASLKLHVTQGRGEGSVCLVTPAVSELLWARHRAQVIPSAPSRLVFGGSPLGAVG